MRRAWRAAAVGALLGSAFAGAGALSSPAPALGPTPPPPPPPAYLDPVLRDALAAAAPSDEIVAIAALPAVATASQLDALRSTGARAVGYASLPYAAILATPTEVNAVANLPIVSSIWGNKPLELSLHESTQQIQATDVWNPAGDYGFTGRGVGVAVLDSGIDGTHPDLLFPSKTIANVKLLGYQKVFADLVLTQEDVPVTDTTSGHGTHVAGIVAGDGSASAGYYRGVAPGADLIGVGAAEGTDMLTALGGYDWVIANKDRHHIRVINNSWADGKMAYDERDPLVQASLRATQAGIVVVFAAGNDGQASGNVFNRYAWPSWVVSVGGVDKNGVLGTYSSRGDADHHADVVAPGSFIASARARLGPVSQANATPFDFTDPLAPRMVPIDQWDDYTVKLGTSMAAPHVAGLAALLLEANPALTPAQVRSIIVSTATPLPACALVDCGAGLVNALAAVQAALAAANHAPVASLAASVSAGVAPLDVVLDASASSDVDGSVVGYAWDLDGDGADDATTSTPALAHSFAAGVHHPRVSVVDDRGVRSAPAGGIEIRASNPPDASATAPAKVKATTLVTFDASASTDPDGASDIVSYTFDFGDGASVTTSSPTATHTYTASRATLHGWRVVVTDSAGVSDAVGSTIKVTP